MMRGCTEKQMVDFIDTNTNPENDWTRERLGQTMLDYFKDLDDELMDNIGAETKKCWAERLAEEYDWPIGHDFSDDGQPHEQTFEPIRPWSVVFLCDMNLGGLTEKTENGEVTGRLSHVVRDTEQDMTTMFREDLRHRIKVLETLKGKGWKE